MGLTTSARTTRLPGSVRLDEVWAGVAGTGDPWYVDAFPWRFRGAVDRLALGRGRRWPVPDTDRLEVGDRAGFWRVVATRHTGGHRLLVLEAAVRAPGTVLLTVTATRAEPAGVDLRLAVTFRPSGVLGAAYLLSDLPARETVVALAHRRLLRAVS